MSADIQVSQSDLRRQAGRLLSTIFVGATPIAQRILDLPEGMRTRRWFLLRSREGNAKEAGAQD